MAADEVQWDYAPSGRDEAMGMDFDPIAKGFTEPGPHQIGRVNKKAIYREYTDATFTSLKPRSPEDQYLGLLGPILHGEVGDTLNIVFKNNATYPFSMHPHGVLYEKDSEGADYNDNTAGKDKDDGCVAPELPTSISGRFPREQAQVQAIPARCFGSTIPIATKCATSPQALSEASSSRAAAWPALMAAPKMLTMNL